MCGKLDAVEKWKTKITFFFFSCVKLMRNYWVHVARHELLPYISLRWSVWLWQRWRAAYATVLITFMLIFFLKFSVTGELTAVLQTWLNLPVECSVLPVCCMGVRVLCLPNGVGTAGTHSVEAVVVVCVRVHVLSGVRLLCRVEILRAVERALTAIEAHICGGGLRHGRGILGSRDGTTGHGDGGLLLLEDRWGLPVHFQAFISLLSSQIGFALSSEAALFGNSSHSLKLAFPNSLDAAARLSTVAAPNPTRAPNYRARRTEPSRAGQRGVDVSFSLARLLVPCLCPEAKTALSPVWLPSFPHINLQ